MKLNTALTPFAAALALFVLQVPAIGEQTATNDGPMLRVFAAEGQITVTESGRRRVLNTVPNGTRLWALETKGDFYRVIDPKSLQRGWIWKRHATPVLYTQQENDEVSAGFDLALEGDRLSIAFKHREAETKLKQGLQTLQRVRGSDHPHSANVSVILAKCYLRMTNYVAAEPLLKQALAINKRAYGPNDSNTATAQYNLAHLYVSLARYEDAEGMLG